MIYSKMEMFHYTLYNFISVFNKYYSNTHIFFWGLSNCPFIDKNYILTFQVRFWCQRKLKTISICRSKICRPCGTYFLLSCKSRLARFGVTPRLLAMQSLLFLVSFHLMQLQTSLLLRSSFRHSLVWPHLWITVKHNQRSADYFCQKYW